MMKLPTHAVLIPYSKGTFVYVQNASQEMHRVLDTPHSIEILEQIQRLPSPRLVAFLGHLLWTELAAVLLERTDLFLIPDPWLKHIPLNQTTRRAEFALQLLEAYLKSPIRHLGAKEPESNSDHTLTERSISWPTLLKKS